MQEEQKEQEEEKEFGPISENSENWYRIGYKPVNYRDLQHSLD